MQATGQIIESEVARIAGRINDTTCTMGVEVDLDNSDLRLTPGMYASATMALDQQAGVLSVPVLQNHRRRRQTDPLGNKCAA